MSNETPLLEPDFLAKIEKLAMINKRLKQGLFTGKRRTNHQGSSIEFADYRTYHPGDDYRQIDWNAYARLEKLFLKTFMDEQEMHISLYIDCSKSMDFGHPSKFKKALEVGAAIGYLSLHHFDRVSVYGFDQQICASALSLVGKGKAAKLIDFFQSLKIGERGSLNEALASGRATLGQPGISIIISDFLFTDGYEKGISFIQGANQEVILVHLFDQQEINPDFIGDIRLIDTETKENKEITVTPNLLAEYQNALKNFKQELAKFAFKRGISYINLLLSDKIENILLKSFRQAGLLR